MATASCALLCSAPLRAPELAGPTTVDDVTLRFQKTAPMTILGEPPREALWPRVVVPEPDGEQHALTIRHVELGPSRVDLPPRSAPDTVIRTSSLKRTAYAVLVLPARPQTAWPLPENSDTRPLYSRPRVVCTDTGVTTTSLHVDASRGCVAFVVRSRLAVVAGAMAPFAGRALGASQPQRLFRVPDIDLHGGSLSAGASACPDCFAAPPSSPSSSAR